MATDAVVSGPRHQHHIDVKAAACSAPLSVNIRGAERFPVVTEPSRSLLVVKIKQYLTAASNEFEAEVIRRRLSDAGIHALIEGYAARGNIPGAASRDIYIADEDLARACEALAPDAT